MWERVCCLGSMRHQGHIEGIELFDASFFDIPEFEAKTMDPEQRLMLETSWSSCFEAGYERTKLRREGAHIGVFVGISQSDWQGIVNDPL